MCVAAPTECSGPALNQRSINACASSTKRPRGYHRTDQCLAAGQRDLMEPINVTQDAISKCLIKIAKLVTAPICTA
jgi:hypothetical protein